MVYLLYILSVQYLMVLPKKNKVFFLNEYYLKKYRDSESMRQEKFYPKR